VERTYQGGLVQFVEDCVEAVFTRLPLRDNYFWQLYMRGAYTPDCCPEYLKRPNFERLRAGLVGRISMHTDAIHSFLSTHDVAISRFVMLDHMDWLSTVHYPVLQQEWQAIVHRALPGTRLLWRSGGLQVDYVDPIEVHVGRGRRRLGELLTYQRDLATDLHRQDRVHTYGSFYIADLAAA
jgi:S-adenosylmethionine-diacylglycerol 3-amino-3-carboxypropyl transferase